MEKITIQDGGNDVLGAIANLGLPIGLSIFANKYEPKKSDKSNDDDSNSQKGGVFLSDSLLLEAGLAVVPFGLIALTENNDDEKQKTDKSPEKSPK